MQASILISHCIHSEGNEKVNFIGFVWLVKITYNVLWFILVAYDWAMLSFWLMQNHIGVVESNPFFSIHVIYIQENKIYIMDSLYALTNDQRLHVYVLDTWICALSFFYIVSYFFNRKKAFSVVVAVTTFCSLSFFSLFGDCCSCNICDFFTGLISPFGRFFCDK